MIFKKALLAFSMIPFLVSCNTNSSIAGTYGFQMGKEAGTHFGFFLELTDNTYTAADVTEEGLKECILSLSVRNGKEEEGSTAIKDIMALFTDDEEGASLKGFYKLTNEVNKQGETRLMMGLSFSYIVERIRGIYESSTEEQPPEMLDKIEQLGHKESVQKLLYATYKKDMVNVYVPVSIEDAVYQLYWYGVDLQIYYTDPNDVTTLEIGIEDVTVHEFGTEPTADEIAAINQTYEAKHNAMEIINCSTTFRSFHQLKMGLAKK